MVIKFREININKWCSKIDIRMFFFCFVYKGVIFTMVIFIFWSFVIRILMVSLMVITEGMSLMFFIICLYSTLLMDWTKIDIAV